MGRLKTDRGKKKGNIDGRGRKKGKKRNKKKRR